MKKLIEQHYYGAKLKTCGANYYRWLAPVDQQNDGAVTMVISPLYDEHHYLSEPRQSYYRFDERNVYLAQGLCCNRKFTAELSYLKYRDRFYCPNCGYVHRKQNVRYIETTSFVPYDLFVRVIEYKEYVKFSLSYKALTFEQGKYSKDIHYGKEVREDFIFNVGKHSVVRRMYLNKKIIEEKELGFLKDLASLKDDTALYYFNSKIKSLSNERIAVAFSLLRNAINKQARKLGYSKRNMGIIGGDNKHKALDSLLKIAHQVRFWDSSPIDFWGTRDKETIEEWSKPYQLILENGKFYDENVYKLICEGKTYHQAVIQTFDLPNIKSVRKRLTYNNFMLMKSLYSKVEKNKADMLMDTLDGADFSYKKDIINNYIWLNQMYPQGNAVNLINYAKNTFCFDAKNTFGQLPQTIKDNILNNPPPLKQLHDELVFVYKQEKTKPITFDISDDVIKQLEGKIYKYSFVVVKDSKTASGIGEILHNCAGTYRNRCGQSLQLVFIKDNDGKYIALLEISNMSIVQAKLNYNKCASSNPEINSLLLEYAEKARVKIKTSDINIKVSTLVQTA